MTFHSYLIQQLDRDDNVSDLAWDYAHDPNAPHTPGALRKYLGYNEDALEVLDVVIKEWRSLNQAARTK